ncbi:MAG: EAL domain-containing protein [Aestuariibacter sp.]
MFSSIRHHIMFAIICVLGLFSAYLLWITIDIHDDLYQKSNIENINSLSNNLASDLFGPLASKAQQFEITTQLLRLEEYKNVRFAAVLSPQNELIDWYVGTKLREYSAPRQLDVIKLESAKAKEQFKSTQIVDRNIISVKPIGSGSFKVGHLVLSSDYALPLESSRTDLLVSVLALLGTMLLIIVSLFYWLQRKLFKPLMGLSEVTKEICKSGNYSLKASTNGSAEVKALGTNFNKMMEVINHEVELNRQKTEELKEQYGVTERLANFDTLTGLYNRQFFIECLRVNLAKARRNGEQLWLLFLDLDGFKLINDSYGHEVGDILLARVAEQLQSIKRESDIIARVGGDEFLILMGESASESDAMRFSFRILDHIRRPIKVEQWELKVDTSIGLSNTIEAHYDDTKLIAYADMAMYEAKRNPEVNAQVFESHFVERMQRQTQIAIKIPKAIEDNALQLVYQPRVNAVGQPVSLEALLRWQDTELGPVSPIELIEVAERSGLIKEISQWVIAQACRDWHHFKAIFGEEIKVSINLSAYDVVQKDIDKKIIQTCSINNIPADRVELEITESAYLENLEIASEMIDKLHDSGFGIALDDFGTGYSSLSYLTQITCNTLKIDRSFVWAIGDSSADNAIIDSILKLGHSLGLSICAEGVETQEQMSYLLERGCHELQGYYFAKPMSIQDIKAFYQHSAQRNRYITTAS